MARRVSGDDLETRVNPDVLGFDAMTLAWEAIGVGVTAYGNDRVVAPMVSRVFPVGNGVMGKLADAVTTGITGWGVGYIAGMANRGVGRNMMRGGALLAIAKGLSAFVPGFSMSAQIPPWSQFAAIAPPPAQLAAGNDVNSPANAGLPTPATIINGSTMGF